MNAPRFTSAAVHKELSTVDTAKGSGPYDLHSFMLQILADFLAELSNTLYNKSLQSSNHLPDFQKGGPGGRGQLPPYEFNFRFV